MWSLDETALAFLIGKKQRANNCTDLKIVTWGSRGRKSSHACRHTLIKIKEHFLPNQPHTPAKKNKQLHTVVKLDMHKNQLAAQLLSRIKANIF